MFLTSRCMRRGNKIAVSFMITRKNSRMCLTVGTGVVRIHVVKTLLLKSQGFVPGLTQQLPGLPSYCQTCAMNSRPQQDKGMRHRGHRKAWFSLPCGLSRRGLADFPSSIIYFSAGMRQAVADTLFQLCFTFPPYFPLVLRS